MNKAIIGVLIILSVLVLAGCGGGKDIAGQAYEGGLGAPVPGGGQAEQPEATPTPSLPSTQGCAQTCKVKEVTVTTSDGDTLPLVPGKGGYTAAGAIEWRVERGPEQCEKELTVPIKITKRNYGKIVSEDMVTLAEGQTSKIIDHPTITTLKFTLRLDDVKVECS